MGEIEKNYWVSWYHTPHDVFELHWPWWVSGSRMSDDALKTVCAGIQATSEDEAKAIIANAYDVKPAAIEWRFVDERPAAWSPFNGRFKRADWMVWPSLDGGPNG